jgi:hypothetical protein
MSPVDGCRRIPDIELLIKAVVLHSKFPKACDKISAAVR